MEESGVTAGELMRLAYRRSWVVHAHELRQATLQLVGTDAALSLVDCEAASEVWTAIVTDWSVRRVVDVSRVWDLKIAALCEHASQLALADLLHAATGMSAQRSLHLGPGARRAEAFAPLLVGLPADREELDAIARVRLMLGGRRACG